MYQKVLDNTQHPYHSIAQAMEAVKAGELERDRITLEALCRDRGYIERITWNCEGGIDDEGASYSYPNGITLKLADNRADLYMGDRLNLDEMDDMDIENIEWGADILGEVAHDRSEADGIEFKSAFDQVIGGIVGIPADQIRQFFWLASCHVYRSYESTTHVSLLPVPAGEESP